MSKLLCVILFLISAPLSAGEVAAEYYKTHPTQVMPVDKWQGQGVWELDPGIDEISLEQTACEGPCPIYSVVIYADGRFRYNGVAGVPRIGQYSGKIDRWGFRALAWYLRDIEFFELKDHYSNSIIDASTTYVGSMMAGMRKVIMNHGYAGPMQLWAIEGLVNQLLSSAVWDDPSDTVSE